MSTLNPMSKKEHFLHEEALGSVNGVIVVKVKGRNPSIGTGTVPENIWPQGGLLVYSQTARRFRIAALGNVNDTLAGTGAQKVLIEGLDENWQMITESLDLAGASASAYTTQSFLRVNFFHVTQVGIFHEANTGDIVLEEETTADVKGYILAGAGSAQQAFFSVPVGFVALMSNFVVGVNRSATAGSNAQVTLCATQAADISNLAVRKVFLNLAAGVGSMSNSGGEVHHRFPEKTDVCCRVIFVAANSTDISIVWDVECYPVK